MLYFVKCRSSQNRPSCWAPYDLRCRCALKPNQTTKLGQNVCLNEPRSSSDIGYMASKTRSLDQVKGKPCEHYRSVSTSFSPNLVRMFVSMRSKQCSNTDHIGWKTRWLCQIKGKPCKLCRGHIFDRIFIKHENICNDWIWVNLCLLSLLEQLVSGEWYRTILVLLWIFVLGTVVRVNQDIFWKILVWEILVSL